MPKLSVADAIEQRRNHISCDEDVTFAPPDNTIIGIKCRLEGLRRTHPAKHVSESLAELLTTLPGIKGRLVFEIVGKNVHAHLMVSPPLFDSSAQVPPAQQLESYWTREWRADTFRRNLIRVLNGAGLPCRPMGRNDCLRLCRQFPAGQRLGCYVMDEHGYFIHSVTVREGPEVTEPGMSHKLVGALCARSECSWLVLDFTCDRAPGLEHYGLSVLLVNKNLATGRAAAQAIEDAFFEHFGVTARRNSAARTIHVLTETAPFAPVKMAQHQAYCTNIADLMVL